MLLLLSLALLVPCDAASREVRAALGQSLDVLSQLCCPGCRVEGLHTLAVLCHVV